MTQQHKNWYENHASTVLDYPFDFERYIEKRLREIEDLDERKFAKEVLLEGLGKVIRCTEQKYKELERRVWDEIRIVDNRYETVMTIVKRDVYDPANGTLYPVDTMDLEKNRTMGIQEEGEVYGGTVYLELSESGMEGFVPEKTFPGTVRTETGEVETLFHIRPAKRYRQAVEGLYHIFLDNHIPWETVNTGYLDRFYDIWMCDPAKNGERIPIQPETEDVTVHFGGLEPYVHYDMIPLWNMEWLEFDSEDFMLPALDGICYEHAFSLDSREERDGYLVCSNEDIMEIRHETDRIIVKSKKETFEDWKVLHMIQTKTIQSLDYTAALLTNRRKDSFGRRSLEENGVWLMTRAGLMRRLMELDVEKWIEPEEIQVCDKEEYPALRSMDWFVGEGMFPMDSRRTLLIVFREKQPGYYLNDSMMRFAVSCLQQEICEYRCVGILTDGAWENETKGGDRL